MKNTNMDFCRIYENIDYDFYNNQMKSINPLRRWFHVNRYRIINNLVRSKYTKGAKILDLGCGSCDWNKGELDVYGIDFNIGLLNLAKSENRLYDFKIADTRNTGLGNETFNIVVASELIEHVSDFDKVIKEINRLLKPGGYAIISVPFDTPLSLWRYLFFIQCFFQGHILGNNYYRSRCGHVNSFSPEALKKAFIRNGFDIDTLFDMRRLTIFLVARKMGFLKQSLLSNDMTIILPTLNEGLNIKNLLENIIFYYRDSQIMVVDDGSNDGTKEIVLSFRINNVSFIDRKDAAVHGLTASVIDAIKLVDTKYFVVMDADGQHPWEKVEDLINQLRLGEKIVIGSRIKVAGEWPLQRKIFSYVGTVLGKISLLMRNKFYLSYDILTGFFGAETDFWRELVFRKDNFNKISLKGYKVLFDFLKIIPNNLRFGEIYYEFGTRKKASSKINFRVHLEYLKSLLR